MQHFTDFRKADRHTPRGRRSFLCSGGHPTGEESVIFFGRNRQKSHHSARCSMTKRVRIFQTTRKQKDRGDRQTRITLHAAARTGRMDQNILLKISFIFCQNVGLDIPNRTSFTSEKSNRKISETFFSNDEKTKRPRRSSNSDNLACCRENGTNGSEYPFENQFYFLPKRWA